MIGKFLSRVRSGQDVVVCVGGFCGEWSASGPDGQLDGGWVGRCAHSSDDDQRRYGHSSAQPATTGMCTSFMLALSAKIANWVSAVVFDDHAVVYPMVNPCPHRRKRPVEHSLDLRQELSNFIILRW